MTVAVAEADAPASSSNHNWENNDEFRMDHHLNNNQPLAESTATVRRLFGPSVEAMGPCWGDCACTYHRIPGHLYATRHGILFYSNLFLGCYEQRVCLLYREVEEMVIYKSTSIAISMVDDCETYIFKSFSDRHQVLHLLKYLQSVESKLQQPLSSFASLQDNSRNDLVNSSTTTSSNTLSSHQNQQQQQPQTVPEESNEEDPSSLHSSSSVLHHNHHSFPALSSSALLTTPQPPSVTFANRRRSVSDSGVVGFGMRSAASATTTTYTIPLTGSFATPERPKTKRRQTVLPITSPLLPTSSSKSKNDSDNEVPVAKVETITWEKIRDAGPEDLDCVCVEGTVLKCPIERFHELFLQDKAKYSLDEFQTETIKDKDVNVTKWETVTTDDDDGYVQRTLSFCHPIKNSTGFGPESARTRREQSLRLFPEKGLVLNNVTKVEGIPSADSFHVQDRWVVESIAGNTQVRLNVCYVIRFTKRSLLKSLIKNSIRKETQEWWETYVQHLESIVKLEVPDNDCDIASATGAAEFGAFSSSDGAIIAQLMGMIRWLVIFLFLFFVTAVVFHTRTLAEVHSLRSTVGRLEDLLVANENAICHLSGFLK